MTTPPRYWRQKGTVPIVVSGLLNLAVLAFTIAFSGFLMCFVDWGALHAECLVRDTCDITAVALRRHPFAGRCVLWPGTAAATAAVSEKRFSD